MTRRYLVLYQIGTAQGSRYVLSFVPAHSLCKRLEPTSHIEFDSNERLVPPLYKDATEVAVWAKRWEEE